MGSFIDILLMTTYYVTNQTYNRFMHNASVHHIKIIVGFFRRSHPDHLYSPAIAGCGTTQEHIYQQLCLDVCTLPGTPF